MLLVIFAILAAIFSQSNGQCNVNKYLVTNEVYNINSPNYPNSYGSSQNCLYQISAPENNYMTISCTLKTPYTVNCAQDKFSVSITGHPNMLFATTMCGTRTYVDQSWDTLLRIEFLASQSQGGSYFCSVKAVSAPCKCGRKKNVRIVGGQETQPNEFPMMAGLFEVSDGRIHCGATIISKRFCLTAAHCVPGRTISNTVLVVGEHDVRMGTDSPEVQVLRIEYFRSHTGYSSSLKQNDIALVRTTTNIIYSWLVGPACLPYKYQYSDFTGLYLTVLGWGSTDYGAATSPFLKKTTLIVQSKARCDSFYSSVNTQFCTEATATDSCQGDSGGPLLWNDPNNNLQYIFGVVSYGLIGCAINKPAINTNVAKFIGWIQTNTGESFCIA